MKKVTFVLLIFLSTSTSFLINAQSCSQGLSVINELWQNFDPMDLVNNMDDINTQVDQLKSEVATFAKYSLKKDAPRLLPVGNGNQKKINLKPGKKRIFLTTPIKQETLELTVIRPETTSVATVTVCFHTLKGESGNLEKIVFPSGGSPSLVIPITDVKGKIISVNIANNSDIKIAYKISAM